MPTDVLNKPGEASQGNDLPHVLETCRDSEIGAINAWYASDFDKRLIEIAEVLKAIIAEQLRAQFNLELETRVASLRNEYEQQVPQGSSATTTPALIEEITAAQERLDTLEADLANRLNDDSFPLGALLRIRGEKLELSSYLRGLTFSAQAMGNRG